MSSSESEDDCYNVTARLNTLKNKYQEDKIETTNLLNDSSEFDEIVKKHNENIKNSIKPAATTSKDTAGPSVSDDCDVSDEILSETLGKRVTRSRARKSKCQGETVVNSPPVAPKRRKKNAATSQATINTQQPTINTQQPTINAPQPTVNRSQPTINDFFNQFLVPVGRNARSGRRGRGSRGGRRNRSLMEHISAIYAIGDADEAYDRSAGQQLFSNTKKTEDVVVIPEEDPLDENEELLVKVYWQSCDVFKFKIRRFQKITQIFDYFSDKHKVSFDNLYFTYNDSILKPDDTPESIGYNIAKFIDGGIVNQSISNIRTEKEPVNGIRLKFQCQSLKKPFEITVRPEEKFSLAMMKCAEHMEVPLGKLKFELDGDSIAAQNTIQELELETGDCIDVKVLS